MDRREAIQKIEAIIDNGQDYGYWTDAQRKALDLAIEALQEPTVSEKESVEDDFFNKSFWRMGLHDSNVRPRTMADTSTNDGDAESATTTEVDYCNNCPYLPWGKDCISRQQAIEAVEEQYFGGTVADINPSWRKLHNILESLPPVTPTERTGEWVNDTRYSGWTCTHCNYHDGNKTDNYCPNCGVKMGGDTE